MKKLLFTLLSLVGFISAWAGDLVYTVDFTNSGGVTWPKSSSYTGTTTSDDGKWTITNANNNNNGWGYVKIGGKSTTGAASYLSSTFAMPEKIDNVSVTLSALMSNCSIASMSVETSADADFTNPVTAATATNLPTEISADVNIEMPIAAPAANLYYRVKIVVDNNTSKNGALSVKAYNFYGEAEANATAKPTFPDYPEGTGKWWDAFTVTIDAEAGAQIYYTTDGSTPTEESTLYNGGVAIPAATVNGEKMVVNAVAIAPGMTVSGVATLTLTAVDPTIFFTSEIGAEFSFDDITLPAGSDYVWKHDNQYLKASAYINKTNLASKSVAYTALDLREYKSASIWFTQAANYFSSFDNFRTYCSVVAREKGATEWTKVGEPSNSDLGSSWTWGTNAPVVLDAYAGKEIEVGFMYESTTDVAGTWEIKEIAVNGVKGAVAPVLKPANMAFSAATAEATVGEAFTAPTLTMDTNATVTYTSSTPATATVDPATGVVTPVAAGTTTIMATAEANSEFEAGSAQYVLTVKEAQKPDVPEPENPQAAGMAFSAATATAVIGETFTAPVLVKATDAAVTYSSSNTDVAVIDGVSGKIVLLKAGTTIVRATAPATEKFLAGSAEYTLTVSAPAEQPSTGRKEPVMYFTPGVAEGEVGQPFTAPVLTKDTDAEVFYTSNNTDVATVNAITGEVTLVAGGNAMITATAPATANYLTGSAFYMLAVKGNGGSGDDPNPPTPGDQSTVVFNTAEGSAFPWTKDGVTLNADKNTGTSNPQFYSETLRLYANNTFTVSASKAIKSINFVLTDDAGFRYTTFTPSVGSLDPQAEGDTEMNWKGDATSVTFTVGALNDYGTDRKDDGSLKAGQIRLAKITVNLGEGGGEDPNPPTPGDDKVATFKWEDPSTLNPAQQKPANGEAVDLDGLTFTDGPVSIAFSRGTNQSTCPRIFTSSKGVTELRFYGDNTATVSADGVNITKIEFVCQYPDNFSASTASTGSFTNGVWTGEASSIDFKFTKVNYNPSCTVIKVYYGEGSDTPNPPTPGDDYETLAAWMAAKPAADAAVKAPLTAVYQNGKDLFVNQGDAWIMVYGDLGGKEYTNGQQIPAGAQGKYDEYNGMPEFIPVASSFGDATDGTPVAAVAVTGDQINDSNIARYVRVEGATVAAVEGQDRQFTVTVDGATFTMWNRWSKTVTNLSASTNADIYGFVGKTKIGDNIETVIFPTRFESNSDTPNPPTPGDEKVATFKWEEPSTLNPAQEKPASGEAVDLDGMTFTDGPVSISFSRGTNQSTCPRIFTSSKGVTELRFYGDNTATVSGADVTISKIEFVCQYPDNYSASTASTGTFQGGVWTGEASSIDFKFTKVDYNPSCTVINVYYTDGGDTPNPPTPPTDETVDFNWAEPTTLSTPIEKPAAGEGVDLDGQTFTAGPVSVSFSRGVNQSTCPRIFTSSKGVTELRFYGDNTATVSVSDATLTKIEFVCQYPDNYSASTASTGSFANGVWTGEAQSVDFKFTKVDYNPSCTVMRVTYKKSSAIDGVEVTEEFPVEFYTLQGVRIQNPAAGQIVIRRQGTNVTKILVK